MVKKPAVCKNLKKNLTQKISETNFCQHIRKVSHEDHEGYFTICRVPVTRKYQLSEISFFSSTQTCLFNKGVYKGINFLHKTYKCAKVDHMHTLADILDFFFC